MLTHQKIQWGKIPFFTQKYYIFSKIDLFFRKIYPPGRQLPALLPSGYALVKRIIWLEWIINAVKRIMCWHTISMYMGVPRGQREAAALPPSGQIFLKKRSIFEKLCYFWSRNRILPPLEIFFHFAHPWVRPCPCRKKQNLLYKR